MRIRLKFTKQGKVKFVGHLDTVRLFQRAIKAAGIPIAYSQGFNPHSLVYFAMPLSVGVSSSSEYMDIITQEPIEVQEAKNALNTILVEDISIIEAYEIEEKSASLMSLVEAADYEIILANEHLEDTFIEVCEEAIKKEELLIIKKTKKGLKEVNIRPFIHSLEVNKEEKVYKIKVHLAAGSKENLSPELLLKAIIGEEKLETIPYSIQRTELYAVEDLNAIPLSSYGR